MPGLAVSQTWWVVDRHPECSPDHPDVGVRLEQQGIWVRPAQVLSRRASAMQAPP